MRIQKEVYFIISLCLCSFLANAKLDYLIKPILKEGESRIEVVMHVNANSDGNATLVYLDEAWGEKNLFECISSIEVLNSGARLKKVVKQNKIYIKAQPFELLEVKYILTQDFTSLAEKKHYYRPIINENYFHLFGHRLFIIPLSLYESEEAIDVEIEWEKTPYIVQHNFGLARKGTYAVTRNELLESVVVGGDFRRETIEVNGIKIHLLARGQWMEFEDFELAEKLESIIKVQRDFWNDYTDDIYTVTLLPLHSENGNYIGGTGLSNGFSSYCSNSEVSRLDDLVALYYHEIMHHWIGGKIRNETKSEELWFSEGFTEYFAHLLMLSEGEITQREFRKIKKDLYKNYKESTFAKLPMDKLAFQPLAAEGGLEKIPYQRGFLYALYLESRFSQKTYGEVDLREIMMKIFDESSNVRFSNDYFKKVLGQYCGQEEVDLFEKFILSGEQFDKRILF